MATVDTLIETQQAYAKTARDLAGDAISDTRADVANIGFTTVSFPGTVLPNAPKIPDPIKAPVLDPVNLDLPLEPSTAIDLQPISPIDVGTFPTFTAAAPKITLPNLPAQLEDFTDPPPIIQTDYVFPAVPDQLLNPLITAPSLGTYVAPMAANVALPSFEAVAPAGIGEAPTGLAAQYVAAYRDLMPQFVTALEERMDSSLTRFNPLYHTQMSAIEVQLTRYLQGGTGLAPAVENQIYERARGKNTAEFKRAERSAHASAAARGFSMPTGATMAAVQRARQDGADLNAAAAREIVVMQAEYEQKNLQFAVTTSVALRTAVLSASISYHGNLVQINSQALQGAQGIVGNVIEVYNQEVRAFEARLNQYRSEAAVYDSRLKAAFADIERYRAEIDAQQALVQIDQAKVSLYRGQIDALDASANVYRTQIEAVVEQAGLERLKLDLFRSKVDVRLAQVQEKRAQLDAYTAAISGQEAQVRIYAAQAGAYGQEINGYRATIDAQSEVVRAQAITNSARTDQVRAAVDIFRGIVQARGDKARTELQVNAQAYDVFDSQNRATIATAELGATIYRTIAQVVLQNAELEVNTLLKNADLNLGRTKAIAELGSANAQVYGTVASAALSGINALASQTLAE